MKLVLLTEKPNVAGKMATTLSKGKAARRNDGPLSYYEFEAEVRLDGHVHRADIVVIPASGHLLGVDFPEENNRNWTYPVIIPPEQLPLVPGDNRAKGFLRVIEKVCKGADVVVSACDLDTEGSAIAYEIIRYLRLHRGRKLYRMEYSSLTPKEIFESFENLKPFDEGRSLAGFTRGAQDFLWGANVTRALTISSRRAGGGKRSGGPSVLSAGRVQSPTLAVVVNREREIENFVPETFFTITGTFVSGGHEFTAEYSSIERIENEELAKAIVAELEIHPAFLLNVDKKDASTRPPPPFNGTDLQVEGSRVWKFSPAEIADRRKGIAQHLYEAGLISYPGTDSQKYPATFGKPQFVAMIEIPKLIAKEIAYVKANLRLPPVEGKKDDPAHPCIHVTGYAAFPDDKHRKLYELIARRNLASMSPDSKEEKTDVAVKGSKYGPIVYGAIQKCPEKQLDKVRSFAHEFMARGKRVIDPGWRTVYPYIRFEEKEMPHLESGKEAKGIKFAVTKKSTNPPPRFSDTSLITELDKLGIGTKNTRHAIIEKLKFRNYVEGKKILLPTLLGRRVVDVLSQHAKRIVDVEFTSHLEERMEKITQDPDSFLPFNAEMTGELENVLLQFKKDEYEIGKDILKPETDEEREKREKAQRSRARKEKEEEDGEKGEKSEKGEKGAKSPEADGEDGEAAPKKPRAPRKGRPRKGQESEPAQGGMASGGVPHISGQDGERKKGPRAKHPTCHECKSEMHPQEAPGGGARAYKCTKETCTNAFAVHEGEDFAGDHCDCGGAIIGGSVKTKSGYTLAYNRCSRDCENSPLQCAKCGKKAKVLTGQWGKYVRCDCGAINYFKRK